MAERTDTVLVETREGPMWAFAADHFITRSLQAYGEYCPGEAALFRQLVSPGMTVVEAGANIGTHSVLLARACVPGRMIAFEPQQRVFQVLCANLALNDITNATVLPEALGATNGEATMPAVDYVGLANVGRVSASATGAGGWAEGTSVRLTTLDALQLTACHFLKIDVEGWEADVLKGARETIARCRPVIYVENDRAGHQGELIRLIDRMDYRQFWHVAPLFRPDNFRGATQDVTGNVASLNMLCVPRESGLQVQGFEPIDPANWRSPLTPTGGA